MVTASEQDRIVLSERLEAARRVVSESVLFFISVLSEIELQIFIMYLRN